MLTRRLFLLAPTPLFAHSISHNDLYIGHAYGLPAKSWTKVMFPLGLKAGEDELIAIESSLTKTIEIYKGDEKLAFPHKFNALKPVAMQPSGLHIRMFYLDNSLDKGDKIKITAVFKKHGRVEIEVWIEAKPYDK